MPRDRHSFFVKELAEMNSLADFRALLDRGLHPDARARSKSSAPLWLALSFHPQLSRRPLLGDLWRELASRECSFIGSPPHGGLLDRALSAPEPSGAVLSAALEIAPSLAVGHPGRALPSDSSSFDGSAHEAASLIHLFLWASRSARARHESKDSIEPFSVWSDRLLANLDRLGSLHPFEPTRFWLWLADSSPQLAPQLTLTFLRGLGLSSLPSQPSSRDRMELLFLGAPSSARVLSTRFGVPMAYDPLCLSEDARLSIPALSELLRPWLSEHALLTSAQHLSAHGALIAQGAGRSIPLESQGDLLDRSLRKILSLEAHRGSLHLPLDPALLLLKTLQSSGADPSLAIQTAREILSNPSAAIAPQTSVQSILSLMGLAPQEPDAVVFCRLMIAQAERLALEDHLGASESAPASPPRSRL